MSNMQVFLDPEGNNIMVNGEIYVHLSDYEKLTAKRDVALAQVKGLQFQVTSVAEYIYAEMSAAGYLDNSENCKACFYSILNDRELNDVNKINSNISARDAEVAKAAFIAGSDWFCDDPMYKHAISLAAEQYANQLHQQVKGE